MKNEKLISLLPIETERLIIKKTSTDDIGMILKMDKQEETQKLLCGIKKKTKDERITFLQRKADKFKNNIASSLTVCLKDGTPIGFTELSINEVDNNAKISYIFDYDYCGQGYCTESSKKLIEIGFKDLKLKRIYADTISGNDSSKRVLEKLGFLLEGTRRNQVYVETIGEYRDFLDYGLVLEEFK